MNFGYSINDTDNHHSHIPYCKAARFSGQAGDQADHAAGAGPEKGNDAAGCSVDREYEQGHIPGAVHVPLADIGDRVKKLKKDKELVVYCRSGNQSIWAIKRLMGMGYKNLYNLKGGYSAWKRLHP